MREKAKGLFGAIGDIVKILASLGVLAGILTWLAYEVADKTDSLNDWSWGGVFLTWRGWGKAFLLILIILVVIAIGWGTFAAVAESERWKRWMKSRERQNTINRIRILTKASLHQGKAGFREKTVTIDKAVEQGVIRIVSLKGYGIYDAKVELECLKLPPGSDRVYVLIPLGTVLVSNGSHQNMVVRNDETINFYSPHDERTVSVPVTCMDFHKSVPNSSDPFSGITQAAHLICTTLEVAKAVGVDKFVTQLAIWNAIENIPPESVAIGLRGEEGRKPTEAEKEIMKEIVVKARELTI